MIDGVFLLEKCLMHHIIQEGEIVNDIWRVETFLQELLRLKNGMVKLIDFCNVSSIF